MVTHDSHERLRRARLYVLVGSQPAGSAGVVELARMAYAGGADVVQLREKTGTDRDRYDAAAAIAAHARAAGRLFVVNDRLDLARAAGADGVHLGQEDLPLEVARGLWPGGILGGSAHDDREVERCLAAGVDYVGLGCCYPSVTKDTVAMDGLALVARWAGRLSVPAFALGGITLERVGELARLGATRIAVSAAIARSPDPMASTRAFKNALSGRPP